MTAFAASVSEGDDLRDAIAAVLLVDVLDDLAAAPHAKVDVDVGHADPFGIQEAFEQQVVLERIDVRDAEDVRGEGAGGGAASRADRKSRSLGA